MVVRSAPTSTTNMTGFLIIVWGFSFANESTTAREMIFLSASGCALTWADWSMGSSEGLSGEHQQVLENGSQTQGRKEGERTHDENGGNEQRGEQRSGDGEGSQRRRSGFFG